MHCHYSFNNSNKLQSETITGVVFDTLDKAESSLKDINKIIVTNGPGNFTSIRVGVSFALGLVCRGGRMFQRETVGESVVEYACNTVTELL